MICTIRADRLLIIQRELTQEFRGKPYRLYAASCQASSTALQAASALWYSHTSGCFRKYEYEQ